MLQKTLKICVMFAGLLLVIMPSSIAQAPTTSGVTDLSGKFIAAGLALGLAAVGAGYGIGVSGAAAIAAVVEKPGVRTTALIFVALAEAIAIYGFVLALLILGQPT